MRYSVHDMSTLRPSAPDGKPAAPALAGQDQAASRPPRPPGPGGPARPPEAGGLPRPTAHRLLVALETHGLVARTAGGAFRLGPRLAELATRADPGLQ